MQLTKRQQADKDRYIANKAIIKERRRINKDLIKAQRQKYYTENKDIIKAKALNYYRLHHEERKSNMRKYMKEYNSTDEYKANRAKYQSAYISNRTKTDPVFKFSSSIRSNIRNSFKRFLSNGYKKSEKTAVILGCQIDKFIEHISSQFKTGMTLNNYGEWHLDHIIPIYYAKAIFIDEEKQKEMITKLCHYSNYQPLWSMDNLKKNKSMQK